MTAYLPKNDEGTELSQLVSMLFETGRLFKLSLVCQGKTKEFFKVIMVSDIDLKSWKTGGSERYIFSKFI